MGFFGRSAMDETPQTISCRCCITGGGPAGMMLGFLLARAGVNVVVLEKHADFFRDFRGDTIHPSTLELIPQWDFLNFIAAQGRRYPGFDLRMCAEATDLVGEDGRVVGLRAKTP